MSAVEDDAGHKNSLLVVEETVDGLEVSGEQDRVLIGTDGMLLTHLSFCILARRYKFDVLIAL